MKWMSVVFLPPDGDSFFFSFPSLGLGRGMDETD